MKNSYLIAKKTSSVELEKYVNDLMFVGWKPIGGLLFAQGYFMQTLIK